MNPEHLLKQMREHQQADYALVLALAGCLARLVPIAEELIDAADGRVYSLDAAIAEIAEAKRLLSGAHTAQKPITGTLKSAADQWGETSAPKGRPVMRSG